MMENYFLYVFQVYICHEVRKFNLIFNYKKTKYEFVYFSLYFARTQELVSILIT